mgnify:CR=1 FL=1
MAKTNFFEYLDFALQFAPPGPEEKAIRDKLASIGVGPGKAFNFKDLSLAHKAELLIGMKQGEKFPVRTEAEAAPANISTDVTGKETYRYSFGPGGTWDGAPGEGTSR